MASEAAYCFEGGMVIDLAPAMYIANGSWRKRIGPVFLAGNRTLAHLRCCFSLFRQILIMQQRMIVTNYILGWFWLDLVRGQ